MKNKKKNKYAYSLGIFAFSFFFFIILLLIIINSVGGAFTLSRIEANSNTEAIEVYHSQYIKAQSEILNQTEIKIPFYAVKWYFLMLNKEETFEEIYNITFNLSQLPDQDQEHYIAYFLNTEPYSLELTEYNTDDLRQWMEVSQKIEEEIKKKDDDYTSGGAGNTGEINTLADFNSTYYGEINPLSNAGYTGQCTWYAWGRANEVNNGNCTNLPVSDAQAWFHQATALGFNIGAEPSVNSIVVYSYGSYGHVAFVEAYDEYSITISEGNIGTPIDCVNYMCSVDYAKNYTNVWRGTMEQFDVRLRGYKILGYIYL